MAKNDDRFEVVFKEGNNLGFHNAGFRQILVDKVTGVHYLCWTSGYGAGITPLLDADGKAVIKRPQSV